MIPTSMSDFVKKIEGLKKYIYDYTYSTFKEELDPFEEKLKHPISRKVSPPPPPPQNLSDEEWSNLMSGISAKK